MAMGLESGGTDMVLKDIPKYCMYVPLKSRAALKERNFSQPKAGFGY